jgi:hypothetical protein
VLLVCSTVALVAVVVEPPAVAGRRQPPGMAVDGPPAAPAVAGAELWVARYDGSKHDYDEASDLGVSPDGTKVFVTGFSVVLGNAPDYATVAYDSSTGAKVWERLYNGPGDWQDMAQALDVSPDGARVFVTGQSVGTAGNGTPDYATIAYDSSTGATLWVRRYDVPSIQLNDEARALVVSPDGTKVFVSGGSFGSTGTSDYLTIAYDASSGARLWIRRYNGPVIDGELSYDYADALAVSPDGNRVFVTGQSGKNNEPDYATVAYEASSGTTVWVRRYNGPANGADFAGAVAVSSDARTVFVTGSSYGSTSNADFATVAYDASTGRRLWGKRYDGPISGTDGGNSIVVSNDGSEVFVGGRSGGSESQVDYAVLAYDASFGTELWVSRYNGPASTSDLAAALGMSPDGTTLFVTGGTDSPTPAPDYATVAYDASTGDELWVSRYAGPGGGQDFAQALEVSPDGTTVFVTGYSAATNGKYDYATVAYATG